jgi:hypothetical protein
MISWAKLLGYDASNANIDRNYLKRWKSPEPMMGDVRDAEKIKDAQKMRMSSSIQQPRQWLPPL